MSGIYKSEVSRLCGALDERVGAFLNRQIEGDGPYLRIDATYVKTREAGRIVGVAGTSGGGCQHRRPARRARVEGSATDPNRSGPNPCAIDRRGLRGVKLVCSDSHERIKAAAAELRKALGSAGLAIQFSPS